jgi:hypothetical protein
MKAEGRALRAEIALQAERRAAQQLTTTCYDCPICLHPIRDMMSTPCGHAFCRDCLAGHARVGRNKESVHRKHDCPTCRQRFTLAQVRRVYV